MHGLGLIGRAVGLLPRSLLRNEAEGTSGTCMGPVGTVGLALGLWPLEAVGYGLLLCPEAEDIRAAGGPENLCCY